MNPTDDKYAVTAAEIDSQLLSSSHIPARLSRTPTLTTLATRTTTTATATTNTTTVHVDKGYFYDIQLCHPLKPIDLDHFVVQSYCSPQTADRFLQLSQHFFLHATVCKVISCILGMLCLFLASARIRLVLAWLHLLLELPFAVLMVGNANAELIRLMLNGWNFRFLVFVHSIGSFVMATTMHDERGWLLGVVKYVGLLVFLLGDANTRFRTVEARMLCVILPVVLIAYGAFYVHKVVDAKYSMVFGLNILDTDVILMADMIVITYIFQRIALNHIWLTPHNKTREPRIVHCMFIQPELKVVMVSRSPQLIKSRTSGSKIHVGAALTDSLPPVDTPDIPGEMLNNPEANLGSSTGRLCEVQVKRFHTGPFDARLALIPALAPVYGRPGSKSRRSLIVPLIGLIGYLGTIFSFVCAITDSVLVAHTQRSIIATLSLGFSMIFLGNYVVCYQRQMFLLLVKQSDTAFAAFQLLLVTVCLCDIFRWDYRAIICCNGYTWYNWVLYLDALPPITRKLIGHKRIYQILINSLTASYSVTVGFWVFFLGDAKHDPMNHHDLYNRVLLNKSFGTNAAIRIEMLSLLSCNLITVIFWAIRYLSRQIRFGSEVFRVLQSQTQYKLTSPKPTTPKAFTRSSLQARFRLHLLPRSSASLTPCG